MTESGDIALRAPLIWTIFEMVKKANETKQPVRHVREGVEIVVKPGDQAGKIMTAWQKALHSGAKTAQT